MPRRLCVRAAAPARLALVAVSGEPRRRASSRATGWGEIRIPTPPSRLVSAGDISGRAGITIVSGPGQNDSRQAYRDCGNCAHHARDHFEVGGDQSHRFVGVPAFELEQTLQRARIRRVDADAIEGLGWKDDRLAVPQGRQTSSDSMRGVGVRRRNCTVSMQLDSGRRGQRLGRDIAAQMLALEVDHAGRFIGCLDRFVKCRGHRGRNQDPPTVSDQPSVVRCGPGVKHLDPHLLDRPSDLGVAGLAAVDPFEAE